MTKINLEQLQQRAQDLRQRVDLLYAKHAASAALVPTDPDAAEVSVDDLAKDCQPTTFGGVSLAVLDQAEAALAPFLTSTGSDDDLPGSLVRGQEQLEKGRQIGATIQDQLRRASALETALRHEVEAHRHAVHDGDSEAAHFAVEQEALLTEKLQLLILIAALLEAAKLCLLDVINLLDRAAAMYRMAAVALNNTALGLLDVLNDAFTAGQILIQKLDKKGRPDGFRIGTAIEAVLMGTPGNLVTLDDIIRLSEPRNKLSDARRAAANGIRQADPLVLTAFQVLLPICLALQGLARLLIDDFLASQEGLSEGQGSLGPF